MNTDSSPNITLEHALIREMVDGVGAESTRELMEIYNTETRGRAGELRTFYNEKNILELKRSAHSLKGASRTYGLTTLADVASELEEAADAQDLAKAEPLLVWIEQNTEIALAELASFVEKELQAGSDST